MQVSNRFQPASTAGQLYLFANDLSNARVAMPQRIDSNASCEVQVLPVLNIPHVASFSLFKHGRRAHVGRDHEWQLLVHKTGGL
jgi:hypothetical protein